MEKLSYNNMKEKNEKINNNTMKEKREKPNYENMKGMISEVSNLQKIKDAPKNLYYKGNINLLDKPIIAVVGSRKCSKYSQNVCKMFVKKLVEEGFVIASGLAIGIDEIAHRECIESGGKTIAILAGGLDKIYPEENIELSKDIVNTGGLLISEKSFEEETNKKNFPKRNRIISGISMGVLIIESKYRGGSNITARYAVEQNKKLFIIPHNIGTSAIGGMRRLLKIGAKLVYSPQEIVNELEDEYGKIENKIDVDKSQIQKYKASKKVKLEEDLLDVYNAVGEKPIDINYIARMTKKQIQTINYSLVDLEIRGYIKKLPGNKYVINNE